jgi:hypothetical protein
MYITKLFDDFLAMNAAKNGMTSQEYIAYYGGGQLDESAMGEIDIIAQEAKSFKDFVKEVIADFKLADTKELRAWLQTLYAPYESASTEFFKGGVANGMNVQDLADKHGISIEEIKSALDKGMAVEAEHTNDKEKAYEIAKDHIFEDPKYYDKLAQVEEAKSGSITFAEDDINQLYGFWGTLEDADMDAEDYFYKAIDGLMKSYKLTDLEALKVLNSKMGRKAADQIVDGQAKTGVEGLEQYYGSSLKKDMSTFIAMDESKSTRKFVRTFEDYVNEGKWSTIMKAVRSGVKSGPWTLVVIKDGKVIDQVHVDIMDAIPANYEDVKRRHKGITLSIEDKEGTSVYNEKL